MPLAEVFCLCKKYFFVGKFSNMNTTKQREYMLISADFRILLEIHDFLEITITTNIRKLSLDFHIIYKFLATFWLCTGFSTELTTYGDIFFLNSKPNAMLLWLVAIKVYAFFCGNSSSKSFHMRKFWHFLQVCFFLPTAKRNNMYRCIFHFVLELIKCSKFHHMFLRTSRSV